MYIADTGNSAIRVVKNNTISTFAGGRNIGIGNQAAVNVTFGNIFGVSINYQGDLFIADSYNGAVYLVSSTTGKPSIVAGTAGITGITSGLGGAAVNATFGFISGVLSVDDLLYVSDFSNCAVYAVVVSTGLVSLFAGTPAVRGGEDGIAAMHATLSSPYTLALDPSTRRMYIADAGNSAIRVVDTVSGMLSTFAGTIGQSGFTGDGGVALDATLNYPAGVAVFPSTGDGYE